MRMYFQGPQRTTAERLGLLSGKLMIALIHQVRPHRSWTSLSSEPHEAKGVGILEQSNNEKDYNAYMN